MTLAEQFNRIENINAAEKANRRYFRRIRIRDYLAGQAVYTLGDYPTRISADPTEYDRAMLRRLADSGVQLIQIHEDWNDPLCLYGADKFSAPDPRGMKNFVELCHSYGIKVIPYASTGYFERKDPKYQAAFSKYDTCWTFNCHSYMKGNYGSAHWREFIIPRCLKIMDEYGFDGLYNDWGYDAWEHELAGRDTILPEGYYDPQVEDLLSQIYSEIKRRGGVYKLHCDRNNAPPCKDRVCDYLWIGEWVDNSPIGAGKEYLPYVVPCLDRRRTPEVDQETHFAYTIPFLQFPLLKTGRPILGNNLEVPNVTYYGGDEQNFYGRVRDYMQKHPDGPYVYSLWSAIPDDPGELDLWTKYWQLYRPMVTENSLTYIELRECEEILSELEQNVYASMFVNEKTYLVVSNLTEKPYELVLKDKWRDRVTGSVANAFSIPKEKLLFLEK